MGFKISRKLFHIGRSQAVTLPAGWCAYYGSRVNKVTILGNSLLIIVPSGLEDKAQKLAEEIERDESK